MAGLLTNYTQAEKLLGEFQSRRGGLLSDRRRLVDSFMSRPVNKLTVSKDPTTYGDMAMGGLNMLPGIGDMIALEDAKREYEAGNTGMAAFNALTALPGIGDAAALAKVSIPALSGIGGMLSMMGRRAGKAPTTPFSNQAGVIGYHGSPHKFDEFKMENIGTGEGAQAYGHGLYFAENPKVAGDYRDNVKNVSDFDIETQKERIFEMEGDHYNRYSKDDINAAKNKLEWLLKRKSDSSIYTVDIPDKYADNFLDWDNPMSDQPEAVKVFARDMGYSDKNLTGQEIYSIAVEKAANDAGVGVSANPETFQRYRGEASKMLNSLGIKGIRYLDGSSRGAGEGTQNFVVFDDKIIKMLERK